MTSPGVAGGRRRRRRAAPTPWPRPRLLRRAARDLRGRHRHQRQDLGGAPSAGRSSSAWATRRPAWARWACAPATSSSPRPGLTTPDAGDVAALLADLAGRGVTHLALEASSHGIDQRRLDGVELTAAGFLNLTQDHLDYHGTMEAYRAAKLRLFEDLLPRGRTAVLNADSDAYPAFAAAAVIQRPVDLLGRRDGRGPDPGRPHADPRRPAAEDRRCGTATTKSACRSPAPSRPPTPWSPRASASPRARRPSRCWRRWSTSRARRAGCSASAPRPQGRRGLCRLRPHPRRAEDGADGAAPARRRPADRGLRRRRRPRPGQAAADGRHRRRAWPTSPSSPTTIRARKSRPPSAPRSAPAAPGLRGDRRPPRGDPRRRRHAARRATCWWWPARATSRARSSAR